MVRRPLLHGLVGLVALLTMPGTNAATARAALPGSIASYPVPRDCAPITVAQVSPNAANNVCVHDLLVTRTVATAEQNSSTFTVVDGQGGSLQATIPSWWPNGGPVAGMVVTLWGKESAGVFKVDHWVEHNHGTGPSPEGPYPRRRLLDVAAGKYPALQMAWVIATPFALDPQNPPNGDGDIHVQTALPCPAAGLTFETTPRLRGYIDHPGFNPTLESTNQADAAGLHTAEAPPVGVPVMMLGQLRVDFGFGWWEVHPVRAWRFLTPAEAGQLGAECANAPVPVLDTTGPDGLPLPFGVPPCTDGSEVGNPGSIYRPCSPHCYVATTTIGKPDTYAGHCAGVAGTSSGRKPPSPGASPTAVGASSLGQSGLPETSTSPPVVIAVAMFLAILVAGFFVARARRRAGRL